MFTRLLTDLERRRIKAYIKADGERDSSIRQLIARYNKHLPQIKVDLELLRQLASTYEKSKKR